MRVCVRVCVMQRGGVWYSVSDLVVVEELERAPALVEAEPRVLLLLFQRLSMGRWVNVGECGWVWVSGRAVW